jgi:hypothetical protein
MHDLFHKIEKYWLLLFYPYPKGSQQKPIFSEVPFRGFRGKREITRTPRFYYAEKTSIFD